MTRIRELVQKYAQFIRFCIAGGFAFSVNLTVLYILTDVFHIYYLVSTVGAFLVAFSISFLLQKLWTFKDSSRDRLHIQLPLYLGMQVISITLNASLMYVFVEYLFIWYLFAQAIIAPMLAIVIFFINRTYIFKRQEVVESV
ncbi:MAG: GtrA family protein [Patescibacteria group bacterium]